MLKTVYTLRRKGDFSLDVRGDNHCGGKDWLYDGRILVRYDISIVCHSLAKNGFVYPQEGIKALLTEPHTYLSCEQYAEKRAKVVFSKLQAEGVDVDSVKLRLSPQPFHGSITVQVGFARPDY